MINKSFDFFIFFIVAAAVMMTIFPTALYRRLTSFNTSLLSFLIPITCSVLSMLALSSEGKYLTIPSAIIIAITLSVAWIMGMYFGRPRIAIITSDQTEWPVIHLVVTRLRAKVTMGTLAYFEKTKIFYTVQFDKIFVLGVMSPEMPTMNHMTMLEVYPQAHHGDAHLWGRHIKDSL